MYKPNLYIIPKRRYVFKFASQIGRSAVGGRWYHVGLASGDTGRERELSHGKMGGD